MDLWPLQLLFNLVGSHQQQQAFDSAKDANLERYDQLLDMNRDLNTRVKSGLTHGHRNQRLQQRQGAAEMNRDANRLTDSVNTAFGDRTNQVMDLFRTGSGDLQAGFDSLAGQYGDRASKLIGDYRGGAGAALDAFEEGASASERELREGRDRNLQRVEGLGEQERKDINRSFDNTASETRANLTARGLTGSTIAPSVVGGVNRRRQDALGQLEDRLSRLKTNIDTGYTEGLSNRVASNAAQRSNLGTRMSEFGGNFGAGLTGEALGAGRDSLAFGERRVGNEANLFSGLSGDQATAMERGGRFAQGVKARNEDIERQQLAQQLAERLGWDSTLTGQRMGIVEGRSDPYPDSNFWLNQAGVFGQMMANRQAPQQETDWLSPAIGAGGSIAGAATAATILAAGICISGDMPVETISGTKFLKDVQVGDEVEIPNGWSTVIGKHFGEHKGDARFVVVNQGDRSIIGTADHVVDGIPLGEHPGAADHSIVPAGDLLLDDGGEYVVNGFVVTSMLSVTDIPALMAMEPENQV